MDGSPKDAVNHVIQADRLELLCTRLQADIVFAYNFLRTDVVRS